MSIMKNLIKLFVVMLVATLPLTSCDLIKKGGTIVVENKLDKANYVVIVKVESISDISDNNPKIKEAYEKLKDNKGTEIAKDGKKSFSYDEDGVYAVTALYPALGAFPATLIGGITETITLKPAGSQN